MMGKRVLTCVTQCGCANSRQLRDARQKSKSGTRWGDSGITEAFLRTSGQPKSGEVPVSAFFSSHEGKTCMTHMGYRSIAGIRMVYAISLDDRKLTSIRASLGGCNPFATERITMICANEPFAAVCNLVATLQALTMPGEVSPCGTWVRRFFCLRSVSRGYVPFLHGGTPQRIMDAVG